MDIDKRRARNKRWYRKHRKEVLAKAAARRAADPEKYRAKDKAYRAAHLEECRENGRLRRKELPEKNPKAYAKKLAAWREWSAAKRKSEQ